MNVDPTTLSVRTKEYLVLAALAIALAYGTLFPLAGWRAPAGSLWGQFFTPADRISFGDIVTNVIVYLPLGFVLARLIAVNMPTFVKILAVTFYGALFSLSLELTQAFLPGRVSSFYDLSLNTAGTALGAILATSSAQTSPIGRYARYLREQYVKPGGLASFGLMVGGLWVAAQLIPFVPSFDVGNIKQGLKPIAQVLTREAMFSPLAASAYAFGTMSLAIILRESMLPLRDRSKVIAAVILSVLTVKIFIVGRQLSLEAFLGAPIGLAMYRLARYKASSKLPLIAIAGLIALLIANGIRVDPTRLTTGGEFNWIPFRGHLANNIIGIADVIAGIWPYCGLAFLTMFAFGHWGRLAYTVGMVAVSVLAFMLEWNQRFTPGRLGDVTDVLIPMIAWTVPWFTVAERAQPVRPRARHRRRRKKPSKPPVAATVAFMTGAITVGTLLSMMDPVNVEQPLDESTMYRLPEPEQLPPVHFDRFRPGHPRLPAPTFEDIARLLAENEAYINTQVRAAKGGHGKIRSSVLAEIVEPGSQDLELLYQRLLELEFISRGNTQVKPLTIAYDWLYDRWTPQQRSALREKVLDGCEFIINVIREKRLSPYNVYLYNSPLQALVACAIATYDESPRADPVMRFTHHLWEARVLPVWRQIMGRNGGWHEGGEYVGIGIGGAVYQIPAMWRHATGDDLFRKEPGLAGFLDFLIYRIRPDNTQFRWGDAGHVDRKVPDRIALAVEYGRNPGYRDGNCGIMKLRPTAWPWGPLADESVCEIDKETRLPLTKLFDGLGLVVARSDWEPDATYVTFKAGDNYWSHSHLDQGAFTIFKGQALAIDSGIYGTGYGTDHHMNYAYQSIAHNVVTVTDPEDIVPAPRDDGHRSFANDGGQRRIGSGWGIEAAPLDLDDWTRNREVYHTGKILNFEDNLEYTVTTADLTAAYTNEYSGTGSFSHRTRRVKQYLRTFVYDRNLDSILVHDRVHITDPEFVVRWLLHTQTKPATTDSGFDVTLNGDEDQPAMRTAGMRGHVVLPRERNITSIGGPGFEFYVDGRNYDENGKTYDVIKRRKNMEPGEWRIELQPSLQQDWVSFLVVMFPWSGERFVDDSVDCEERTDEIICFVEKSGRVAEYKLDLDNNDVTISHEHDL